MAEAKKVAASRRLRLVRLRPEAVSSGKLDAMADCLSDLLGIDRARARGLLLQMRPKKSAA